ncbi:hypothetical protein GALL_144560 [mine drainage metagenome]|uniref:Uncharacterized protein n=1 Tax=mine drainage metagenome TaxID=410659 RepID=A0A1J5S4L4_9ZZZZ
MKKYFIALILCFVFYNSSKSQKIIYSPVQDEIFSNFITDVICKKNNKIFVYTAFYDIISPGNANSYKPTINPGVPKTNNGLIEVFDNEMHILYKKPLLTSLNNFSAVHFVVFENYFNMFYQYQKRHTIYYMVAKFDFDVNMIGTPIKLAEKNKMENDFPNQLFSNCYSENKKHFIVYSIWNDRNKTSSVNCLHYDENFRLIKSSTLKIPVRYRKDYLHDFNVDDDGNLIFLRTTKEYKTNYAERNTLIIQPQHSDSIIFKALLLPKIFADEFHVKIDNKNKRYILTSFYSSKAGDDMEGLYTFILNIGQNQTPLITTTVFGNELRKKIKDKTVSKDAFNDFFIQHIHLKNDGGFLIDAENLVEIPERHQQNRWSFYYYSSIQLVQNYSNENRASLNFSLDNFYNPNYYFPWHPWEFFEDVSFSNNPQKTVITNYNASSFISQKTVVLNFNADGNAEWMKVLNTPQRDELVNSVGYVNAEMDNSLYFLYNENILNKIFITAQSINDKGEINVAGNLKEDKMILGSNTEYTLLPRFGKQVSEKEVVLPCLAGRYICFAKIEL